MKVSYNWLKELLGIELSPQELAKKLTAVGLPVETIEPLASGLEQIVVAELTAVDPHPNADRLSLTTVNAGENTYSIVCGAQNIKAGDKVPLAPMGSTLPGGLKIKKARLRGVESEGMLCSAEELELELIQTSDGLLQLPADSVPGQSLTRCLGLDDYILDIELTANRSDCLSVRGLTTEIAATLGKKYMLPLPRPVPEAGDGVAIDIQTEHCPRYTGMVIEGVKVGPSPLWAQLRLLACGMRPVNNIVDATNLVMLEWGQPLHAFDLNKLPAPAIAVRQARSGEKIVTLDDKTRELTPEMMLITSGDKPVAIAGVMGSLDSEVDAGTNSVLLESAHFAPLSVRKTAKALGINSEAAARFEKGIDPAIVVPAAHRAASLIQEFADGRPGKLVSVGQEQDLTAKITVDLERVNRLLGTDIQVPEAREILDNLGLAVSEGEVRTQFTVKVAGRRQDLRLEEDIAEELGRIYGLDKVPARLPVAPVTLGMRTRSQRLEALVRETLVGCGLNEMVTYAFISPEQVAKTKARAGVPIANPLTRERSQMRGEMLPSVLETLAVNLAQGRAGAALFELGTVYRSAQPLPAQHTNVVGALCGEAPVHWQGAAQYDFYAIKGVVEQLLAALGIDAEYIAAAPEQYHPGRCALVKCQGKELGYVGQVHPEICVAVKLEKPVYYFDLSFGALIALSPETISFQAPSRYPAIHRDLAVEVDSDVTVARLHGIIEQIGGELLESVQCFDVYSGANLGPNRKSLAFALSFRHQARTLKDKEVQALIDKIISGLEQEAGARLRGR
ncbi:MAG: phenylalanine--tRNA ligase subunit beta [Firmicutes bacterium]|nr:phenylalanine--tRNA ligase subunit beta [Bacillota bacterium]